MYTHRRRLLLRLATARLASATAAAGCNNIGGATAVLAGLQSLAAVAQQQQQGGGGAAAQHATWWDGRGTLCLSANLQQQQQLQQHRHMSLAATEAAAQPMPGRQHMPINANKQQQQQQQQQQQLQQQQLLQQRTRQSALQASIMACTDISRLVALITAAATGISGVEAMSALHHLNRLCQQHQQTQQQPHNASSASSLSRQAAAAAAAAAIQAAREQLTGASIRNAQPELQLEVGGFDAQLQTAFALLSKRLREELPGLAPEQLVQVAFSLAKLKRISTQEHNMGLLLAVLRKLQGQLASLPAGRQSQLAAALARLNASNLDAAVLDGSYDAAAAAGAQAAHAAGAATSSSEQQQAAAEAARVLLGELCDAVQAQTSMDATSLAVFVGAMARLGHYSWPAMRHVCSSLLPAVVQDLTPTSIAQLLVGCTRLQHYDQQMCAQLAAAAERSMPEATGEQVARIVWSLTHQRHEQPGVYEAAARQAVSRVAELGPRHVSSLAWAFAVRRAYSPALYDALAGRMLDLLQASQLLQAAAGNDNDSTSTSSSSSSTSSSSSSSRTPTPTTSGSRLVTSSGDEILPQHLSLMCWALAKQGHTAGAELLQAIGDKAASLPGDWRPQNISNLAFACGGLGVKHTALLTALAEAARTLHLDGFNQQNISDLAWGTVAAGHVDPKLLELIWRATSGRLTELSPHSLSDLTWAFASARVPQASQLLADAAPVVLGCLSHFNAGMLAELLWSYAATGVRNEALFDAAAGALAAPERTAALAGDVEAQAKVIYALKALGWRHTGLEEVLASIIPSVHSLLVES